MSEQKNAEQPAEEKPQVQTEATVEEEAYFYHPVEISGKAVETLDEQEAERLRAEVEQKMQEILQILDEETLQLSEFLMEEKNLTVELCTLLRHILKKLHISFNIPPKNVPLREKMKKVVLNEECHLIVMYEKGEVDSMFLAEYPPEIVMAVLWDVIPELAKAITIYRKKISTRVNFFGKLRKQLKNIFKAMVASKGNARVEEGETLDAVKQALEEKPEQPEQ
ncbi:MAG TPA: hypothetical protein ENF76_03755 [Candidatus Bathyarchaeota archaeon]|nr:MAG: hypothetical protein DRO34_03195 [Candidatus Bathyarchaeota archaeon]HDI07462.1 hypothetical protein [Candidatus Bathyarchaeota archaeon]